MAWAVSIFFLVFLIGSISADKPPKIINGTNTVIQDFPYLVSIRIRGVHDCGGSIISDRHILTAAHCVDRMHNPETHHLITVHSGTSRTDRVGNVHKILSVHVHPTFDLRDELDGSDDIAVLTLKEPIVFNKNQQKVNLPSRDIQKYQVADVVGWGRNSTLNWGLPTQLQKLKVVLLRSEKCQPYLITRIDQTQVCGFRSSTSSTCHGDSGGPIVSHGEVVGIVSSGDSALCADGKPEIYTNVFAFEDFIESVMNE